MKKHLFTLAAATLCLAACTSNDKADENIIEMQPVTVADGRFTPEVMWSLGQIGEYAVSPDGSQIVYGVKAISMEQNKGNAELYLMPTAGGEATRLTTTAASEFNPVWMDDNTSCSAATPRSSP